MDSHPEMLILCGGLGHRLRAVVADRPKAMALVEGRPFIEYLIAYFRRRGIHRFVLCAGYLGEQVIRHFHRWPGIEILVEFQPLGTGGSVWSAAEHLTSDYFFVCNGDSFCAVEPATMLELAQNRRALAVVAMTRVANPEDYGTLEFTETGRLLAFREKRPGSGAAGWINAGCYCFSREALRYFPAGGSSLEREVLPGMLGTNRIFVSELDSELLDIGTPERFVRAAKVLQRISQRHCGSL